MALGELYPNQRNEYVMQEKVIPSTELVTPKKESATSVTAMNIETPMRRASLPSNMIKSSETMNIANKGDSIPSIIFKPNIPTKKPSGEVARGPPIGVMIHTPPIEAPPREPFGILTINIVKGKNLKAGYGPLGKANPFVNIKIGERECKSSPAYQEGRNPEWGQSYDFEITTEKEIELEVFDEQEAGHYFSMGRAKSGILDWMAQGQYDGSIDLLNKQGHKCGELIVKTEFRRNKSANTPKDSKQDNQNNYSDDDILDAFRTFDLDKNNYIGAAELRHILLCIGERVTDEEVRLIL